MGCLGTLNVDCRRQLLGSQIARHRGEVVRPWWLWSQPERLGVVTGEGGSF